MVLRRRHGAADAARLVADLAAAIRADVPGARAEAVGRALIEVALSAPTRAGIDAAVGRVRDVIADRATEDRVTRSSIGVAIASGEAVEDADLIEAAEADLARDRREAAAPAADAFTAVELNAAIARDEFILHFQPLCRTYDGLPIGAEALVRWRRDGILVPPSEFIPIAEECGQIVELGAAILRMACRQAVRWNEDRTEPFVISVNVSAHQFRANGFVELIVAVLNETGLAPHCLELEITESVFLHEVERTETILRQLKQIGVSIALDDFGTGYSSLSYLSRFLVDRIKIDRSFVQTLATQPRNKAIVQTIISLGHELGLKVIAEGVETIEQRKILSAMGCLELQGYLFGRPGPDFAPGIGLIDEYDDSFSDASL